MAVKKHDAGSIAAIVMLVAVLIYSFMSGNAELLGRLLQTQERVTVLPAWDEPQEGEIVTIVIATDGDVIKHSSSVHLQGAIEFTGMKDDKLVLQMTNGVWSEIGRHLIE